MTVTSGTHLGVYRILEKIGEGGMGQVYRAHDTRLDRDVAIKVLPEAFAHDPDRLARFLREARTLASLNHPNIAIIHGLEETDGVKALVMELVEGDDLSQVIARTAGLHAEPALRGKRRAGSDFEPAGQPNVALVGRTLSGSPGGPDKIRPTGLPLDEALPIAKQIAEALEVAHEQGIIHRDLKPANIKVRPDGTVKVLDFGLAKAMESPSATSVSVSQAPTIMTPAMVTGAGIILGTAAYMSPEQARGKIVDKRADIWAFGAVLFEMLTGTRPFEGEDIAETLGAVIHKEPVWSRLPTATPASIRTVLQRCLQKDPRQRVRDIGDVRLALEGAFETATILPGVGAAVSAASLPGWRRALSWVAGLACAALAAVAAWQLKPEPPRPIARFTIQAEDQQFTVGWQLLALSPDGGNLVYAANQRLYLREMSDFAVHEIPGTEGPLAGPVTNPVFSPDGQMVAFYVNGEVKRLALSGGAAVTVSRTADPIFSGMSWDEDSIVFAGRQRILRVSPAGGEPETLVTAGADEVLSAPQLLPGGRAVLFSVRTSSVANWDQGQIVVQRLDSGERKTLVEAGAGGRYVPTGHLVYPIAGNLFAVPFDLPSLSVTGGAVSIVEGVRRSPNTANAGAFPGAQFSYSATGSLAFVPGPSSITGTSNLALFDRAGEAQPLGLRPGRYDSPRVSPDGNFVAFGAEDASGTAVWVYELAGGKVPQRLTFGGKSRYPIWSRDGLWVAFQSDREGGLGIFRQRADGSGQAEPLTTPEAGAEHIPQSWSNDGVHLLFSVTTDKGSTLRTLNMQDRQVVPFAEIQSIEPVEGAFSPDGRWVAYRTKEAQVPRGQVFLTPFPPTGEKYLVCECGHAYWSPRGNELLVNTGAGRSAVIPVTTAPRVTFGEAVDFPRGLRRESGPATTRREADSMPDGQHVIGVMTEVSVAPTVQINIVQNWFDELKRLVPTK
jgi:serine/threonine-protein kinase